MIVIWVFAVFRTILANNTSLDPWVLLVRPGKHPQERDLQKCVRTAGYRDDSRAATLLRTAERSPDLTKHLCVSIPVSDWVLQLFKIWLDKAEHLDFRTVLESKDSLISKPLAWTPGVT